MKSDLYSDILATVSKSAHLDVKKTFDLVCSLLRKIPGYDWTGIYVVKGGKLVLVSYDGEKTDHDVISLGDGLCSLAIVRNDVVNEFDVRSNDKYLACFPSTRSELVVPIRFEGKAIGELDIDSDKTGAFSDRDEKFLLEVGEMISRKVQSVYEP